MKRYFLFSFILLFICSAFSQNNYSNEELRLLIQEEKESLASMLDEISLLSNLLERKFTIKKYFQMGDLESIKKMFNEDQKEIDRLYEVGDARQMLSFNNELKATYGDIDIIAPFYLYNDARAYYLQDKLSKAQVKLEEIVEDYPSFEHLDESIVLLQEIYFKLGLHKEFISLYVKSTNKNSLIQRYWLAQSHYNIENYNEAISLFDTLVDDKNFGFRSKAMLALISNFTKGSEFAIEEFSDLAKSYKPETPYYSFVLLMLARLYASIDEIDLALQYYQLYVEYHPTEVPDEILFEIGLMNKNNERYMESIIYFNMIMRKPIKTEYYASAKILANIARQQSGEYQDVETGLTEIISLNDILLETLNAKYGLMDKYKELKTKLDPIEDPQKRDEITSKMEKVEEVLLNTNQTLKNLYNGNDASTLAAIQVMEEEYIYYTLTIDMMNTVVELAKSKPNARIPKEIENQILEADADILQLTILNFLGHLPENQISVDDYQFAQELALEKIYDTQLIDMWTDVRDLANTVDQKAIAAMADRYVDLLKENLNSYDVIAKYRFNGAPPEEFKNMISNEISSIDKNNEQLEALKQDVIAKFNIKIAERLDKQKQVLIVENENLRNLYDKVLSGVINDVKIDRDKNEYTLLNVLYEQTRALDVEYEVKQDEIRKELQTNQESNENE